ncbi:DUF1292 domain-containing protein [Paenibacillus senegalensis]|uniref:DUF1292 domain-containing protein n=1 Tax=Paenibacillus senegalensis TaxID=1465766 RepID=UPI0002894305|nr:DUF1292 domain-containing protein [Paenibacillus senegalensis]
MHYYQGKDARPIDVLKQAFGEEIDLIDGNREATYTLLAEFALGTQGYAVLAPQHNEHEEELAIFRVVRNEQGEPQLESIEDEEEWENVSEVYDEITWNSED